MKHTFLLLVAILTLLSSSYAQSNVSKKITIEDDGTNATVVIETTENGATTVEELSGDEARAYMIARDAEMAKAKAKAISEDILTEIDTELTELSEEIDKMVVKVVSIEIDSLKEDIEKKIEIHKQCVKEQMDQAY